MKIWNGKHGRKVYQGLTSEAQAVIGLISMGIEDLDEIAWLLPGNASFFSRRRLAELVSASTDKMIIQFKVQPPPGMSAAIRVEIPCPICGEKVFSVPCQFCCCIPKPNVYTDVHDQEPVPEQATRFLPGSPGKLMVLSSRLAHGEPLWHPNDARWPWPLLTRCQDIEEESFYVQSDEVGPEADEMLTECQPAKECEDEPEQRRSAGSTVEGSHRFL